MSKKYVPEGVYLACNKGTCPSQLRVSNDEKTSIYGAPMATEADIFPFFNLKPMGFCTDPSKIYATGVMCIPTITEWEKPKDGITINGNRMLLEDSTCKCILGGGDISIHFDVASANKVALWGGAKMPTEYIKEGFDWAFANMDENRAARDAILPDWMQGVAHAGDWFGDLSVALVEGAVTGVVGLGEVIYQVAQDPVGMTEAVGGMLIEADNWVKEKEMQALVWASHGENWSKAADDIWNTTTQTDWTQVIADGASATWQGTKDIASWIADNPRKIGVTVGEFIPDVVAVAYTGGVAIAATATKKVGKEVVEEIVEEAVEEAVEKVVKETAEEAAEAGGKKALKEGAEALIEKKADDLAKVVTTSTTVKLPLKGGIVELKNIISKPFNYIKRSADEVTELRRVFNNKERKSFLTELLKDESYLKSKGLTDIDIARMKDGLNPKGYQVHHKYPLDDSGTNSLDNLVLIKNDPYHKALTVYQNSISRGMDTNSSKIIDWYTMEGTIYP